jgi:cell wall-associated NlpC family hydrolase
MTFGYQDLIGKPFRFGGRGPDEYDCWGLVRECLRRQGLNPPDYPSAELGTVNAATLAQAAPAWTAVQTPAFGCVVAFRMNCGMASHVGIVVGRHQFLHVLEHTHTCVERLSSPLWRNRITGFYLWEENA